MFCAAWLGCASAIISSVINTGTLVFVTKIQLNVYYIILV